MDLEAGMQPLWRMGIQGLPSAVARDSIGPSTFSVTLHSVRIDVLSKRFDTPFRTAAR
jgi:hypothetical protein